MNSLKLAALAAVFLFTEGCASSYSKALAAERVRSDKVYGLCMDEVKTRLKMGFEVKSWEEEIAYCEGKATRKRAPDTTATR